MFNIRLRAWALAQFLSMAALCAKGLLIRFGLILIGRDAKRVAVSFGDLRVVVKDELWGTVVLGHLNPSAFTGLENDFPELRGNDLRSFILLHSVAMRTLDRLATGDPRKTGWLCEYAREQQRHFSRCARCRGFVHETIREDVAETRRIRDLLRRAHGPRTFDR